jgi:hypothetical protein
VSDEPTQADEADAEGHSIAEWALDTFVYAPTGLVLTAVEDMPELVAKGRARIELQVRNARFLGRFVVDHGTRDIGRRLGRTKVPTATGEPPDVDAPAVPGPTEARLHPVAPATAFAPAPPDIAIPDYDTLSASQVVRRLDGLGPAELEAVYRHEAATRSRRTILHRAQQLLGTEDLPGR